MAKISSYYATGLKEHVTDHIEHTISTVLDDNYAINGSSLSVDPNIQWIVPASMKVTEIKDIFKVITGNNFKKVIDYYLFPMGYYVSKDLIGSGSIPVNMKMVGNSRSVTITEKTEPFKLGIYNPDYNNSNAKTIVQSAPLSREWKGPTVSGSQLFGYALNEVNDLDIDDVIKYLNTYPTKSSYFNLFGSKVWRTSDGKPITLISQTPIIFSQIKLPTDINEYRVSFHQKTETYYDAIIDYYVCPSSKTWVIEGHDKVNIISGTNNNNTSTWLGKPFQGGFKSNIVSSYAYYSTQSGVLNNPTHLPLEFSYTDSSTGTVTKYPMINNVIIDTPHDVFRQTLNDGVIRHVSQIFYWWYTNHQSDTFNETWDTFVTKIVNEFNRQSSNLFDFGYNYTANLKSMLIKSRGYDTNSNYPESIFPSTRVIPMIPSYWLNRFLYAVTGTAAAFQMETKWIYNIDKIGFTAKLINQPDFGDLPRNGYGLWDSSNSDIHQQLIERYKDNPFNMCLLSHNPVDINCQINKGSTIITESLLNTTLDPVINLPYKSMSDDYKIMSFSIDYDPDEAPVSMSFPITNSHYSEVRSTKDDLITSYDIEELIGLDKITDDYFSASLITHKQEVKDKLNEIINTKPSIDSIVNDAITSIDKELESAPDDQKLSDKQKWEIKDKLTNVLTEESKNSNFPTIELDDQEYETYLFYKRLLMSRVTSESKVGVIGHNRILSTNSTQSPLYNQLVEDLKLSDTKIKQYSNLFKEELDSTIGGDSFALIDSIDVINEVNMLNGIVSTQVTELLNSIESVSSKLGTDINSMSKDETNNLYNSLSSIFSSSSQMANSIIDAAKGYNDKAIEYADKLGESYDSIAVRRNVTNVTGYLNGFASSLLSDPYIALKQHSEYLKSRLSKVSLRATVIDGMLAVGDIIPKIPQLTIDGIKAVGSVIGALVGFALNTAAETVTIIDNVDKLVYISEQYLSKGISGYSTVPTVFDKMFEKPNLLDADYFFKDYKTHAVVEIEKSTPIIAQIKQKLTNTKNNPIIIGNDSISYNDYDITIISKWLTGYYYPNSKDDNYPLIMPISDSTIGLYPDLTEFVPKYPQRGSLWKLFVNQLALKGQILNQSDINETTDFIPLTPSAFAIYTQVIGGAATLAAIAAGGLAALRGDWIGMGIGAIAAITVVATANFVELGRITMKRGMRPYDNSIYTYFKNNYDSIKNQWSNQLDNTKWLTDKFTYVMVDNKIPLFSDASELKKFFITVKEVLFLIGNIATLVVASFFIGKMAQKISAIARKIKFKRALKLDNKRNKLVLEKENENLIKQYDQDIENINNDQTLSEEEKKSRIEKINEDKKNLIDFSAGKVVLNSENKANLNGILASNYGFSTVATSASAGSVLGLSQLGSLSDSALSSFKEQVDKFNEANKDLDIPNPDQGSGTVEDLLGASSSLFKYLVKISEDTDQIKRYT